VRRSIALVIALSLAAVAACDAALPSATVPPAPTPTTAPSAAPSGSSTAPTGSFDADAIYDQIEREVAVIRGLQPKVNVPRTTIDEAQLREVLAEITAQEQPPEELAATEQLYRGLGLLGPDQSLAAVTGELLGDQVAGFYRTDTGELYVVSRSGDLGVTEKIIFAHEYDHALGDQHFGLDSLTEDAFTEGDRALARTALIEGDGTLLMSLWAQEHLSFTELLELVGMAIGPNQEGLEDAPPFVRESLLFPYEAGLNFAMGLQLDGGWDAVNRAFASPPDSTEQILHPEKYAAREAPLEVDLPDDLAARMGEGWTQTIDDTFGEFQIGAWLRSIGADAVTAGAADAAAAGWGGDRIALLEGPDDAWAIAWETAWDTPTDAQEFAAAVPASANADVTRHDDDRVSLVLGSDDATRAKLAAALDGA
jgi:hypothetical protein